MASYALQTPPRVAHAMPPGPKERKREKLHISSNYAKIFVSAKFLFGRYVNICRNFLRYDFNELDCRNNVLLAQAALRAPPEVAFAMRSWPLLLQNILA